MTDPGISSKFLVQEKVMTKAGLFDTFLVETSYSMRRSTDASNNQTEVLWRTWYAPAIDHWVRRTLVARTDEHLRASSSVEPVGYGRKDERRPGGESLDLASALA